MNELINAAHAVSKFVKENDYPEKYTPEFDTLTRLLNDQEIALKMMGHPVVKK